MTVSPVQSTAATSASAPKLASSAVGGDYKTFLKLLVTELKNQDPLKPVDPTQTVTQLATFSSLEQAVRTNDLLTKLTEQTSLSQGASLVGRTVASADGSANGKVASVALADSGVVLNLVDGSKVPLGAGVSIS